MGKKNDLYRKRYQKKNRKSGVSELKEWENKLKALPWKPNQRHPSTGESRTPLGFDKQKIYEALQEKKENYGFGKYILNTKRLGTWEELGKKFKKKASNGSYVWSRFRTKRRFRRATWRDI